MTLWPPFPVWISYVPSLGRTTTDKPSISAVTGAVLLESEEPRHPSTKSSTQAIKRLAIWTGRILPANSLGNRKPRHLSAIMNSSCYVRDLDLALAQSPGSG